VLAAPGSSAMHWSRVSRLPRICHFHCNRVSGCTAPAIMRVVYCEFARLPLRPLGPLLGSPREPAQTWTDGPLAFRHLRSRCQSGSPTLIPNMVGSLFCCCP